MRVIIGCGGPLRTALSGGVWGADGGGDCCVAGSRRLAARILVSSLGRLTQGLELLHVCFNRLQIPGHGIQGFLIIFIRHLRLFLEPTPFLVRFMERFDGFFQLTSPTFFLSNAVIVVPILAPNVTGNA